MVGISSNSVEIGGAAPMLSPAETVTVAAEFLRSLANADAKTAAPMFDALASIAPCKSLSCRT